MLWKETFIRFLRLLILTCEILYGKYAHALWREVFLVFGIQWVMPKMVASLFFGCRNCLGKHSSNIWNMVNLEGT